ncbi:hypothetical protein DINM_003981 [Dirofilaria immitis]|nr:hypothetical protein [Dirofilaria immitis]
MVWQTSTCSTNTNPDDNLTTSSSSSSSSTTTSPLPNTSNTINHSKSTSNERSPSPQPPPRFHRPTTKSSPRSDSNHSDNNTFDYNTLHNDLPFSMTPAGRFLRTFLMKQCNILIIQCMILFGKIIDNDEKYSIEIDLSDFVAGELSISYDEEERELLVEGKQKGCNNRLGSIERNFKRKFDIPIDVHDGSLAAYLPPSGPLTIQALKKGIKQPTRRIPIQEVSVIPDINVTNTTEVPTFESTKNMTSKTNIAPPIPPKTKKASESKQPSIFEAMPKSKIMQSSKVQKFNENDEKQRNFDELQQSAKKSEAKREYLNIFDVNEFIQPNTSEITIEADAEQDNMSIADVLRQTANEFLRDQYLQGFEFHEDCKLYYNPMTGYYYDQSRDHRILEHVPSNYYIMIAVTLAYHFKDTALFYHPSTNCYYYYDNQADSYVYYTRIPCEHTWTDKLAERKAVALLGESFAAGMTQDEVDVFECLNSLLKIVLQTTDNDSFDCDVLNDEISIYIQEERMGYAPCVRIIEKASGALHVVTITGARIGSASDCEIQLSSEQFSENEYSAVISYNETEQRYFMTVKGREPVIFRNKIKIDMDEVAFIDHGDEWQFGEQEFLAHIHYGTNTCGSCEPGLLKTDHVIISELDYNPLAGKISKETLRRRNLRSMKKSMAFLIFSCQDEEERYRCKYQKKERNFSCNNAENKDKSIYANCLAKPLPIGILEMIATTIDKLPSSAEMLNESNRGFGMLQRMGWKQGTGLGRREDGITEPLTSKVRPNRAGLGLKNEVKFELSKKQDKRQHLLEITRKRFQKAEIFAMADDGQDDTM